MKGVTGYVGSHACNKMLAACGSRLIVYDNLATGNRWAVCWGALEHDDILDRARLNAMLATHQPQAGRRRRLEVVTGME